MKINFVTSNIGKFNSMKLILQTIGRDDIELVQAKLDIVEPQVDTVREVSVWKARQAFEILKEPVLVEDGGFCISALKGFPGVYSKYVIGTIGVEGLLQLMEGKEDRRVRVESCTTFIDEDGEMHQFDKDDPNNLLIAREVSCSENPQMWSEFAKIIYVPKYDKILCDLTVEEMEAYFHNTQVDGSMQRFARWLKDNL